MNEHDHAQELQRTEDDAHESGEVEPTAHPLYPERSVCSVTIRGTRMPGWFTGAACIWTGGSSPRCIGPFDDVALAMTYAADRHPGAQFFPYSEPSDRTG